jgi:hypothetical protein
MGLCDFDEMEMGAKGENVRPAANERALGDVAKVQAPNTMGVSQPRCDIPGI